VREVGVPPKDKSWDIRSTDGRLAAMARPRTTGKEAGHVDAWIYGGAFAF